MESNENESEVPKKCPKCGSDLVEREGKYGKFLGCTNFPECRYTYDLSVETTGIQCPDCGKNLRFRSSQYGRFLSCSGYPECKFAYNPEFKEHPDIFCPKCGKVLEMKINETESEKYLACTGHPECDFRLDWGDAAEEVGKKQVYPQCPKCGRDLVKRRSKYGFFLGCSSYPECRFAFNPEFEDRENIFCPECGQALFVKEGKYGKFVGCSGFPECKYTFDLRS